MKAYLLRRTGKLDAWLIEGMMSRFRGPRIANGKITIEEGTYVIDPNLFFRVSYPYWWQKGIIPLFMLAGLLFGAFAGLIGLILGPLGGVIGGILFTSIFPIPEKEVWGQMWQEGVCDPMDLRKIGAGDPTSARALKFASRIRKFAIMEAGQPQWLLMLIVGGIFLIAGFAMGKL